MLVFGLRIAPRVFTKVIRPVFPSPEASGVKMVIYYIIIPNAADRRKPRTAHLGHHPFASGFLISTVLTTTSIWNFLGF